MAQLIYESNPEVKYLWSWYFSLACSMKFGLDWTTSRAILPSVQLICLMNRRNHQVILKMTLSIFQLWTFLVFIEWVVVLILYRMTHLSVCASKARAARTNWATFCPPCPTWLSLEAAFARWQENCRSWPVTWWPPYRWASLHINSVWLCDSSFHPVCFYISLQDRYNTWREMDITDTREWWM